MGDAENTKLIYKLGTCFGCRKCLYCSFYLDQNKCKCPHEEKPTKNNRTPQVQNAYTRNYNPTWPKVKLEYIQQRINKYNYQITLKKGLGTSWCSSCNSAFGRLKASVITKIPNIKKSKEPIFTPLEINNLIIETSHSSFIEDNFSESDIKSDSEFESIKSSDNEFEIDYRLFIKKADGNSVPAKCYIVKVLAIDDLLDNIRENVITLLENELVDPSDYTI